MSVQQMSLGPSCGDLLRIGPLAGSQMNRSFCGVAAKAHEDEEAENEELAKDATIIHATNRIPNTIVSLTEELIIDFLSDLSSGDGGTGE